MTDDIRSLTARLAAEPASLVFLDLGESLRRRGQLDAALAVVLGGVQRYPALAEAHDLLARVCVDRGEGDRAFDAWTAALRHDPRHVGALRGLAYLAFRAGDLDRAKRHLAAALAIAPEDSASAQAMTRLRERRAATPAEPPATPPGEVRADMLLVDGQGRRLSGVATRDDGTDVSDAVAAELAGVTREADRATRLLGLGPWRAIAVECRGGQLHLTPPTPDTVLLVRGAGDAPSGRLALQAERAAAAARRWLERMA